MAPIWRPIVLISETIALQPQILAMLVLCLQGSKRDWGSLTVATVFSTAATVNLWRTSTSGISWVRIIVRTATCRIVSVSVLISGSSAIISVIVPTSTVIISITRRRTRAGTAAAAIHWASHWTSPTVSSGGTRSVPTYGRTIASAVVVPRTTSVVVISVSVHRRAPVVSPSSSVVKAIVIAARRTTAVTKATSTSTTVVISSLTSHIFHSEDASLQLSTIRNILGTRGFLHSPKLHKCIVALHVDSHELSVRLEKHFEVFSLGRFFMKVDDKERLGGLDILATIVFLALDSSVSSGKLCAESCRDIFHLHSADGHDEPLGIVLVFLHYCIFQEDEAVPTFLVKTVHGDGLECPWFSSRRCDRSVENGHDIVCLVTRLQIPQKHRAKSASPCCSRSSRIFTLVRG
mmetsp:Transcript_22413/g.39409  ORF Transcript_22413/g.39409 Transcript_22413/m.39409 type:complete len:405 (-) Transcript_22413:94-1308(-)